jgi:hypothetical protein
MEAVSMVLLFFVALRNLIANMSNSMRARIAQNSPPIVSKTNCEDLDVSKTREDTSNMMEKNDQLYANLETT